MINAIAIDAAFANMGLARVGVSAEGIQCRDLRLLSTEAGNRKVVRVSSDNLRRVTELASGMEEICLQWRPQFAFVEVPSGAMDAKAATALGMATGVFGSVLTVLRIPIIEVSPAEVKAVVSGSRTKKASKADIIAWAEKRWPDAPWLRYERDGKVVTKTKKGPPKTTSWKRGDLMNDNEHLADAMAIVAAGIATPEFRGLLALSGNNHAAPSTSGQRPSSRRIALV